MKNAFKISISLILATIFLLSWQQALAVICDCPSAGTYHGPEATIESISYSNCTLTYSGKITKWPSGYTNCANSNQPPIDRIWATLKSSGKNYTIPGYCLNKDGVYCKYYAQKDHAVCARIPSIPGPMPTQNSNSFSYSKKIYLAAGTYEVYAAASDGSEIYADKYGSCSASKTESILPNEASRSVKTSVTLTVTESDAKNCLATPDEYLECSSGGSCGDGTIQDINGEQCEAGNDPCSAFGIGYSCNTATCKCEKKTVVCNKNNICESANGEDKDTCQDCVPSVSNLPVGNITSDSIEFRANIDRLADWSQVSVNFDWYQVGGSTGLTSGVIKSSTGEAMYKMEELKAETQYCYNARMSKYPNLTNVPAVAAVNGWVCATTGKSNQSCGDSKCTGTENADNCEKDCGTCGNGFCEKTVPPAKCPADNTNCAWKSGETATNCVIDCFGKNSRIKTTNPINIKTDAISFMGEVLDDNSGQSQYFFKWWKKGEELIGERQTIKMSAREGFTTPFAQNGLEANTQYCYRACIEDKVANPVAYCDPAPAICTTTLAIENNDCSKEFVNITSPKNNQKISGSTITDATWSTFRTDGQEPKCGNFFQYYTEVENVKISIKSPFYTVTMPPVDGRQEVKIFVRGCMDGTCAENKVTAPTEVSVDVSSSCLEQYVGNKQFLEKTKASNPLSYSTDFFVKTVSVLGGFGGPTYYRVKPDGSKEQIYNGKVAQNNLVYVELNKPQLKYALNDGGLMSELLNIETSADAKKDYLLGPPDIATLKDLPISAISPTPQFGMVAGPNEGGQDGLYRVDSTAFTKITEDAGGIFLFVNGTKSLLSTHKISRPVYYTYQTLGNKYFNSGCYPEESFDIALDVAPENKAPYIVSMSMDPITDCKDTTLKMHALAWDPDCDTSITPEKCSEGLSFYWKCVGPTGELPISWGGPGEVHGMNPTINNVQVDKINYIKCTVTVYDNQGSFINDLVAGKIGAGEHSSEKSQTIDISLPQCSQKPTFGFGVVLAEECVENPRLSINWWLTNTEPPSISQAKLFVGNSLGNWFEGFNPFVQNVAGNSPQFLTPTIPGYGYLTVGLQLITNTGIESGIEVQDNVYFPSQAYNIPTISSADTNFMTGETKFMVKTSRGVSVPDSKNIYWYVFDKTTFPNISKSRCYEWPIANRVANGPEFKQAFNLGDSKMIGVCVFDGANSGCGDMVEKKPGSYPRFGSGGGGGGSD